MRSSTVLEHDILEGTEQFAIRRVKPIRPERSGKGGGISGSAFNKKKETENSIDCGDEE